MDTLPKTYEEKIHILAGECSEPLRGESHLVFEDTSSRGIARLKSVVCVCVFQLQM